MEKIAALEIYEEIRDSGWDMPLELLEGLTDYEKSFVRSQFAGEYGSVDWYVAQCQRLGIVGHKKVLDAGAGMGQWAIAAARLNDHVVAQDINIGRLEIARAVGAKLDVKNMDVQCASAENSGAADSSFDAVICHGTFMFTDMPKTLQEFHRVLRPGGFVYLTANSAGWYLHLILDRIIRGRQYSLLPSVYHMLLNTLQRKASNVVVSESGLRSRLTRAGFDIGKIATLGGIRAEDWSLESPPGRHPESFYGLHSIIEAIAYKKS